MHMQSWEQFICMKTLSHIRTPAPHMQQPCTHTKKHTISHHHHTHNVSSQHTPWGPGPLVTALNNSNYIKFQEYLFQFSNFLTSSSILAFKWERMERGTNGKGFVICACAIVLTLLIFYFFINLVFRTVIMYAYRINLMIIMQVCL